MILMTYVAKFKNYNPTFTTASMYKFIGSNLEPVSCITTSE